MVNTADTHENSDEFSLRVCFPSGLVGLKEVHMPVPILISGAYALKDASRRCLFQFRTAGLIQSEVKIPYPGRN
ncbi:hypothetical protein DWX41_14445 [Hungatella hathewayi]|uniref:Uncharacterized protein n=1 Tax=Hungatella hathewayi TaxID=154046 RepID=A0A3E2WQJ9_9FIRM|nr:hypothetical protein DWX41_14445 [Hungatella hathewayi]GKH31558.1 hypothetical protein CE91St64_09650 [Faecalicatena contorta]